MADTRSSRERIWALRRSIDEALRVTDPIQTDEDIVVPVSQISALVEGLHELERRHGLRIVNFGHAGDGNMHSTLLKPQRLSTEEWESLSTELEWEIFRLVDSMGGVISGEHGIGSKRKKYFMELCPETKLLMMRKIKEALDPNGIMNPGKIFD